MDITNPVQHSPVSEIDVSAEEVDMFLLIPYIAH